MLLSFGNKSYIIISVLIVLYSLSIYLSISEWSFAQSVGAVEYTDCTSAEG